MFKRFWNDTVLPIYYMITALIHTKESAAKPKEHEIECEDCQ